jgi:hypothetical protein
VRDAAEAGVYRMGLDAGFGYDGLGAVEEKDEWELWRDEAELRARLEMKCVAAQIKVSLYRDSRGVEGD